MQKKLFLFTGFFGLLGCGLSTIDAGTPRLNLFNPYDVLVLPPERPDVCWQATFGYEGAFSVKAYQADEDENGNSQCFRKRADALQLFQDEQDFLAGLKGDEFESSYSQFAQKFNLDDDDGTFGLYIPCGKFKMNNYMFSLRRYLPHGFTVGAYLPVISMKLENVTWRPAPNNNNTTFESQITNDLITDIENLADINLRGWDRTGVGDFALLTHWSHCFPQARPLLKNVDFGLKAGLTFPTGKHANEDVLLGLPFGYNAGVGILFGGKLELWLADYYRFGIDAELLQLFGETRERRIKTDLAQTDLLFLQKVCAFTEPGFTQHFTLYLEAAQFCYGLSARFAYQYTKQQEDKLFLGTDHFDCVIANTAESLQEWTTHSLVWNIDYDFYNGCDCAAYKPYVSLFVKYGFNGSRALLASTAGAIFSIDF